MRQASEPFRLRRRNYIHSPFLFCTLFFTLIQLSFLVLNATTPTFTRRIVFFDEDTIRPQNARSLDLDSDGNLMIGGFNATQFLRTASVASSTLRAIFLRSPFADGFECQRCPFGAIRHRNGNNFIVATTLFGQSIPGTIGNQGQADFFYARLNALTGVPELVVQDGTNLYDEGHDCDVRASDNTVYVVGRAGLSRPTRGDFSRIWPSPAPAELQGEGGMVLAKYNSQGSRIYAYVFGEYAGDKAYSIRLTGETFIYVGGDEYKNGVQDIKVYKLAETGTQINVVWASKDRGHVAPNLFRAMVIDPFNDDVIVASSLNNAGQGIKLSLTKWSSQGNFLWEISEVCCENQDATIFNAYIAGMSMGIDRQIYLGGSKITGGTNEAQNYFYILSRFGEVLLYMPDSNIYNSADIPYGARISNRGVFRMVSPVTNADQIIITSSEIPGFGPYEEPIIRVAADIYYRLSIEMSGREQAADVCTEAKEIVADNIAWDSSNFQVSSSSDQFNTQAFCDTTVKVDNIRVNSFFAAITRSITSNFGRRSPLELVSGRQVTVLTSPLIVQTRPGVFTPAPGNSDFGGGSGGTPGTPTSRDGDTDSGLSTTSIIIIAVCASVGALLLVAAIVLWKTCSSPSTYKPVNFPMDNEAYPI